MVQSLEDGLEICAVFLDYRKTFDSVPHRILIDKLEELYLNPYLISWVADYLTARIQQVVVDGTVSDPSPVLSGVPQCCLVSPSSVWCPPVLSGVPQCCLVSPRVPFLDLYYF